MLKLLWVVKADKLPSLQQFRKVTPCLEELLTVFDAQGARVSRRGASTQTTVWKGKNRPSSKSESGSTPRVELPVLLPAATPRPRTSKLPGITGPMAAQGYAHSHRNTQPSPFQTHICLCAAEQAASGWRQPAALKIHSSCTQPGCLHFLHLSAPQHGTSPQTRLLVWRGTKVMMHCFQGSYGR